MFEEVLQNLTSVLIIAIFFLLLEYRPPWWRSRAGDYHLKKRQKFAIPGPVCLPVLGSTWIFFTRIYQFNKLHEFYYYMYRKYGPIVKQEAFLNIPVINLFEKGDIEKIIRAGSKYPLRPPTAAVAQYRRSRPDRYSTTGLVNEQGETWLSLRTALTPILTSPKTISDFLPQIGEITDDFCNLIRQSRDGNGTIYSLDEIVDKLALEISCAFVLGLRMGFLLPGSESQKSQEFANAVRQHFLAIRDTYFGLPLWQYFPTSTYRKLTESEEIIYKLALDLIKTADDNYCGDSAVFQHILKCDNVDPKEKIVAIVDFLAAGIHTLKNSFLFFLHLVAENAECQEKILTDSTKTYLKACLTESFRLYPTANTFCRITEEDLVLGGFKVNAGSVVVCHTGVACRDSKNFDLPNDFIPERWLSTKFPKHSPLILIPFGAGKRICPGKRLIEHVLPLILLETLKMFRISTDEELKVQFEFLLSPQGPISMNFRNRN